MRFSLFQPARSVVGMFAGVLFPPLCYSCGALLPSGHRIVCPACMDAVQGIDREDPSFRLAQERLLSDGTLDDFFCLYRFVRGSVLQNLLHQLKYGGAPGIGVWLGELLGSALRAAVPPLQAGAIVPVPLHTAKKRERGYNQSAYIAEGIGCTLGLAVRTDVLRRIRHTSTQTALDIEERRRNMEAAFAVRKGKRLKGGGRGVLLVDDVITTGATIRSCAGVLRRAGFRNIYACSVGLADRTNL